MSTNRTLPLTGLLSHPTPRDRLRLLYNLICRYLQKYPEDCDYRRNTENIIQYRSSVIEVTQSVPEIECMLNCGRIEQIILEAERELYLTKKLLPYKPWEPLVDIPPDNQWKWPNI